MIIGVPKELIDGEYRVSLTPAGVHALVEDGHQILIESSAGDACDMTDDQYREVGAVVLEDREALWAQAEMICKVKEPIAEEYDRMREGQIVFTYLHLAAQRELTEVLLKNKVTAIAYETVMLEDNTLPLLAPMSEVAGRMAVQIGANLLQAHNGGRGVLLAGVPGVLPARVLVIGGGVVGQNAARIALGIGARVTIADINVMRLKEIDLSSDGRIFTLNSNPLDIMEQIKECDLLIGAVLIPGARAPKVVTEEMVKAMKKGSVIVDVAIDQGGCVETMDHTTSHANPFFVRHDVIHYSVPNIPGAVPRTATQALTGVTLPYIRKLAKLGLKAALTEDEALRHGLNTYQGKLVYREVAQAFDLPYTDPLTLI